MFEKGNTYGRRFNTNNQPTNRRKAKSERLKAFFDAVKADPLTAEECAKIDATLLGLTREELERTKENDNLPQVVRCRAEYLLTQSFEASERLQDRAFGRPRQKSEVIAAIELPKIECKCFGDDPDES